MKIIFDGRSGEKIELRKGESVEGTYIGLEYHTETGEPMYIKLQDGDKIKKVPLSFQLSQVDFEEGKRYKIECAGERKTKKGRVKEYIVYLLDDE